MDNIAEMKELDLEKAKPSLGKEIGTLVKKNIKAYMMYIALVVIMGIFQVLSGGIFLTARNISNLINQTGYVAILAIGMTLILILKHIDLSVGYVAGFSGAIAAVLMTNMGWGLVPTILCVLAIGLVIGIYQGTLVTLLGVPAFVTTLAGMFIFRGLLSVVLKKDGTIIVENEAFNELSNGYIKDLPFSAGGIHLLTLLIGMVAIALVWFTQIKARKNKQKYNFEVVSFPIFFAGLVLVSLVIMGIIVTLAEYNGLPWTAVIVGVVLFIYNFMLNKTKLGRYIYGIGGNEQAAELSGVNVKKVTLFAFCSMSVLASLAGILYTSRIGSAAPNAGVAFEMDAIASAYIGGVAVSGGIGKVTNTIIGALIIQSLANGLQLINVDITVQYIIKGIIFIIAVAFDVISRKKAR